MSDVILPPMFPGKENRVITNARQMTLIGANGAGKSRFMSEMIELNGDKAFCLSALSASFPEREESHRTGSIDELYRAAASRHSYIRTDAVCELDKLVYMVFADELEYLFKLKEHNFAGGRRVNLATTKLDTIRVLWERFFPGNRMTRCEGSLMFATQAGNDLISIDKLSQGEKSVLYYIAAVLYAMPDAVIFVDSPTLFIHPSITVSLWDAIEALRPDCTFVYDSTDVDFVSSRSQNICIWIKSFDSERNVWTYETVTDAPMTEEIFIRLAGSRKPMLFVEGDTQHSIDIRLYSAVFRDWNVRPLGSCDKVIETTRAFNDLKSTHHLRSRGIVDRDRRTDTEVGYLRRKEIMVPEVAEVENIFLLETVIRVMARRRGRDPEKVVRQIRKTVIQTFKQKAEQQALQHVRHKMKRDVECKIDARFSCITALETHIRQLIYKLEPRKYYNMIRENFAVMIRDNDYNGILKVFNHKPMLSDSGLPQLLGYHSRDEYVNGVLQVIQKDGKDADTLRAAVRHCLQATDDIEKI